MVDYAQEPPCIRKKVVEAVELRRKDMAVTRIVLSSNWTLTVQSSYTRIPFDQIVHDNFGLFDTSTNLFNVSDAGNYIAAANIRIIKGKK